MGHASLFGVLFLRNSLFQLYLGLENLKQNLHSVSQKGRSGILKVPSVMKTYPWPCRATASWPPSPSCPRFEIESSSGAKSVFSEVTLKSKQNSG